MKLYYSSPSNSIVTYNLFNANFYQYYLFTLQNLITSFTKAYHLKVKVKGKGYYLYKNYRNTLTHQLGHSHRTYIYAHSLTFKFFSKVNLLIFGLSKTDTFKYGRLVKASKPLNIFTSRGVRFARQVVYKKTGKVSSYR